MKNWIKYALTLPILILIVSCSTVTTKEVTAHQPSLDGNVADSGVKGFTSDHYAIVTPLWVARYNLLTVDYGSRFTPPITKNYGITQTTTNILATKEALSDHNIMLYWKNNPYKPR